ncbi:MAG: PolC-type DNA polymerase III [Anaerovoracaceae bacterium]|jgi:DNA polymerase-3 subunit alpha (Gram-positive type)
MGLLIDDYLKEGYEYEFERVKLSRDAVLRAEVRSNFVVPFGALPHLKSELREKIDGVRSVQLVFHYRDMAQSEDEIVDAYMPYLRSLAERASSVMSGALTDDYSYSDGVLTIFVVGETAKEQFNEHLSGKFAKILSDYFGINAIVCFENSRDKYMSAAEDILCSDEADAQDENPDGGKTAGGKEDGAGTVVAGRGVKGRAVPIESLPAFPQEPEKVTCQGVIFKLDKKETRKKKIIFTIEFADETGAAGAKLFADPEKKDVKKIEAQLSPGNAVRIRGSYEMDSFTRSPVIIARSIELAENEGREDNSDEKRVELHCHTKMSALDGFNDVKELVETAVRWGHKALAITDHGVVHALPEAYDAAKGRIKILLGTEGYLYDDDGMYEADGTVDYKSRNTTHIVIIAKNRQGLFDLYRLISESHIDHFYKRPRILKSELAAVRENMLLGSACVAGEFYSAVVDGRPDDELLRIADFYDYLEVQPLCNNEFLTKDPDRGITMEDIKDFNRKVIEIGGRLGKPVVATTDAHYGSRRDAFARNVVQRTMGYNDAVNDGLFFRTTEEMLGEFSYLDDETARRIVIDNPNMIADMTEDISPVAQGKFPPKIKDSDERLRSSCEERAREIYGDPLPDEIKDRLDKELHSIIDNGYSVMYIAAQIPIQESNKAGYPVGSRGSVGSSFAATMAGITEVNPLKPHYICPNCRKLIWGDPEYETGPDMPDRECPDCGEMMKKDGYNIPFETFLGFDGTKEPDIDLNFAQEFQTPAQRVIDDIFGAENTYKAGTIGTVKERNSFGYINKYCEETGRVLNQYEKDLLVTQMTGVKTTTGQHPGGIIVKPADHSIYEFTPVQYPANKDESGFITTHFDYHKIDSNLLKLDMLGHKTPSMIRMLKDLTGIDPETVPIEDKDTLAIFSGIDALDIKDKDYHFTHGTYGIPEFGTNFVRGMLDETHPKTVADLIRISGFSHGTDVWNNNARDYVMSGQITMDEAISTRDDIMDYLIKKGLEPVDAFNIMEKVRKGKGVTEERAQLMREHDVPDWYLDSCRKISYMFPKAHATAYVITSLRCAYFKVHYPPAFYATWLTYSLSDFNWDVISRGKDYVWNKIEQSRAKKAEKKEKAELTVFEVVYEMLARGYEFMPPSLEYSDAERFGVRDGKVLVPLAGISGIGPSAAVRITDAREERPFETVEEIGTRAGVGPSVVESMRRYGLLEGLPESNQISFF